MGDVKFAWIYRINTVTGTNYGIYKNSPDKVQFFGFNCRMGGVITGTSSYWRAIHFSIALAFIENKYLDYGGILTSAKFDNAALISSSTLPFISFQTNFNEPNKDVWSVIEYELGPAQSKSFGLTRNHVLAYRFFYPNTLLADDNSIL